MYQTNAFITEGVDQTLCDLFVLSIKDWDFVTYHHFYSKINIKTKKNSTLYVY